MNKRQRVKLPLVRPAEDKDAEDLRNFRCSSGATYEDEVEAFIREKALARVSIKSVTEYNLLVVEDDRQIIGCAAYHEEPLILTPDESALQVTRFQLLAVRLDQRGRRLDDSSKLVDFIFESVVLRAFASDGHGVLNALVARLNARSLAVCERNGLTNQTPYDNELVRLVGTYVIR